MRTLQPSSGQVRIGSTVQGKASKGRLSSKASGASHLQQSQQISLAQTRMSNTTLESHAGHNYYSNAKGQSTTAPLAIVNDNSRAVSSLERA